MFEPIKVGAAKDPLAKLLWECGLQATSTGGLPPGEVTIPGHREYGIVASVPNKRHDDYPFIDLLIGTVRISPTEGIVVIASESSLFGRLMEFSAIAAQRMSVEVKVRRESKRAIVLPHRSLD